MAADHFDDGGESQEYRERTARLEERLVQARHNREYVELSLLMDELGIEANPDEQPGYAEGIRQRAGLSRQAINKLEAELGIIEPKSGKREDSEAIKSYVKEDAERSRSERRQSRHRGQVSYRKGLYERDQGVLGYAKIKEITPDNFDAQPREVLLTIARYDEKRIASGEDVIDVARSVYYGALERSQEFKDRKRTIVD